MPLRVDEEEHFWASTFLDSIPLDKILLESRSLTISKRDLLYLSFFLKECCYGSRTTIDAPKRALIICSNSPIDYACYLACVIAGISVIPLSPVTFREQREKVISSLGPTIVVTPDCQKDFAEQDAPFLLRHSDIFGILHKVDGNFDKKPLWRINLTAEVYVIATSGTTGSPKFVPICYKNVFEWQRVSLPVLRLSDKSRFSGTYPLFFDASAMFIFGCLASGCTLVVAEKEEILLPLKFAERSKLTHWASVPSILNYSRSVEEDVPKIHGVEVVALGGEVVSANHSIELSARFDGADIVDLYGPSETTIFILTKRFSQRELESLINFTSLPLDPPACQWKLVSDSTEENVGELLLSGDQVFEKYTNTTGPVANPKDGWYSTGDIFRFENGLLHCLGRIDNEIKLRGQRVTIEMLETILSNISGIKSAACVISNVAETDIDVIYTGKECSWTEVSRKLTTKLPLGIRLGRLERVSSIPQSPNGKIDRRALTEYFSRSYKERNKPHGSTQ